MNTEVLSEQAYEETADKTLREILNQMMEIPEDFEADLSNGILTIEFEDGVKYILNSHRAARQIWMAAERSAWHFDYQLPEGTWIATKSGDELWSTVEGVLGRKLGKAVKLTR